MIFQEHRQKKLSSYFELAHLSIHSIESIINCWSKSSAWLVHLSTTSHWDTWGLVTRSLTLIRWITQGVLHNYGTFSATLITALMSSGHPCLICSTFLERASSPLDLSLETGAPPFSLSASLLLASGAEENSFTSSNNFWNLLCTTINNWSDVDAK